jgi:hypothetical protein
MAFIPEFSLCFMGNCCGIIILKKNGKKMQFHFHRFKRPTIWLLPFEQAAQKRC